MRFVGVNLNFSYLVSCLEKYYHEDSPRRYVGASEKNLKTFNHEIDTQFSQMTFLVIICGILWLEDLLPPKTHKDSVVSVSSVAENFSCFRGYFKQLFSVDYMAGRTTDITGTYCLCWMIKYLSSVYFCAT